MKNLLVLAALSAVFSIPAKAQFVSLGSEKASIRWNQTATPNYRVIYPEGLDSLGLKYASLLEYYRPLVGASATYLPNQAYRRPMPVVLHPYGAISNGAVSWAPKQMTLFTFPDAYGSLSPVPWEKILSIHENRHVAQWQFARSGFLKVFSYPFGELPAMYLAALLEDSSLAEGDAVAIETALTTSGRGRTSDFLSYYRMAFDNGDFRSWYKWRYGSQKYYTPDYYRLGYVTAAGGRLLTGDPLFVRKYIYNPLSLRKLNRMWKDISSEFAARWAEDDSLRGPFQAIDPVTAPGRFYTVYTGTAVTSGGRVFALRAALDRSEELVEILPDGSYRRIRPMSASSKLVYSPFTDCLYWSETAYSRRWDMQQDSRIRMMKAGSGKIADFTKTGKYVNPAVSEDGRYLAAGEYIVGGRSRIVLFSLTDGGVAAEMSMPDGLQVTEMAFEGGQVVFTGISEGGMGLYRTDFSSMEVLEDPQPYKIKDMISRSGEVWFTSDRTGTNEIYSYSGGVLTQHTHTKYGVSSPYFIGDELRFTALTPSGRMLAGTRAEAGRTVSFSGHASYPVADSLSAQESRLSHIDPVTEIPAPVKYSKAGNFFHVHSWLPVWYETDGFKASETDFSYESVSAGATLFFQNLTGTASGSVGLSVHENPFKKGSFAAGLHARMRYTGLYPVLDFALDLGDRNSGRVLQALDTRADSLFLDVQEYAQKRLYVGGGVTMSFPLNFSSGGWSRSIEPFVSATASADMLGARWRNYPYSEDQDYDLEPYMDLSAGMRWSVQLPVASSAIYPRIGTGGAVKAFANPFSAGVYAGAYAFLPGLMSTHGLKLSVDAQFKNMDTQMTDKYLYPLDVWNIGLVDMAPRGLEKNGVGTLLNLYQGDMARFSADYAMPALPAGLAIGPLFYIRNMELVPFADLALTGDTRWNSGSTSSLNTLYSVGADIMFRFERFILVTSSLHIGVRVAYNGGTLYDGLGLDDPLYVGTLFKADL